MGPRADRATAETRRVGGQSDRPCGDRSYSVLPLPCPGARRGAAQRTLDRCCWRCIGALPDLLARMNRTGNRKVMCRASSHPTFTFWATREASLAQKGDPCGPTHCHRMFAQWYMEITHDL